MNDYKEALRILLSTVGEYYPKGYGEDDKRFYFVGYNEQTDDPEDDAVGIYSVNKHDNSVKELYWYTDFDLLSNLDMYNL